MVNEIFNKLGIYDLVAVLLSGICIMVLSISVNSFFKAELLSFIAAEDTFSFLIISYFVGLVFQELGSLFHKKVICKNNKLLLQVLNTSNNFLTQSEKDGIFRAVKMKLPQKEGFNEEILYNYCKFYLISNGNTARVDKDQSIYGISRSLSLYFFVLSLGIVHESICTQNVLYFIYAEFAFALSVLLHYRCIRFAKMRYAFIFRSFYYSFLQSEKNEEGSNGKCKGIKGQRNVKGNPKHTKKQTDHKFPCRFI